MDLLDLIFWCAITGLVVAGQMCRLFDQQRRKDNIQRRLNQ